MIQNLVEMASAVSGCYLEGLSSERVACFKRRLGSVLGNGRELQYMEEREMSALPTTGQSLGKNPRYANYARAHGRTPEQQLEQDRLDWPGGVMTGFLLWNRDRLCECSAAHPEFFFYGGLADPEGYDAWLTKRVDGMVDDSHEADSGRPTP